MRFWTCSIDKFKIFDNISIGEGNGSPLQCSCLENPRDGGAWWAAIYGVAKSRHDLVIEQEQNPTPIFFSLFLDIPEKSSFLKELNLRFSTY